MITMYDGTFPQPVDEKGFELRKKKLLLSIESWLFNRDPYIGLWNNPYIIG